MPFQVDTLGTLETNLLRYWKMDEGSGTTATDAKNNIVANLLNGATWGTGKVGTNCISFDGVNDFVNSTLITSATTNISMCAWVQVNDLTTAMNLIHHGSSNGVSVFNGIGLIKRDTSAKLQFHSSGIALSDTGYTFTQIGTWIHIAFTRDTGSKARAYVNGVQTSLTTMQGVNTPTAFNIGAMGAGGGYNLNGLIDEVGFWSKVLNATEISDLYNSGAGNIYSVASIDEPINHRMMLSEP